MAVATLIGTFVMLLIIVIGWGYLKKKRQRIIQQEKIESSKKPVYGKEHELFDDDELDT